MKKTVKKTATKVVSSPSGKKIVKAVAKPVKKAAKPVAKSTKKPAAKKRSASAREVPAVKPIKELMNKTALLAHLIETSGVEKKPVLAVLTALEQTISASLHPRGAGEFMMPGLFKIVTKRIPASKGGVKKPNPFKPGEMMVTKAKPATIRVKIRPLAKVKLAAVG